CPSEIPSCSIPLRPWPRRRQAERLRARRPGLLSSPDIPSRKEPDRVSTTTIPLNGALRIAPGTKLLGEILSWSCAGLTLRHLDLVLALRESGLDERVARELLPRHAFARACRKLAKQRIIRPVAEDSTHITFQFTQEKAGDRYEYT